jgi:hypothetical protein
MVRTRTHPPKLVPVTPLLADIFDRQLKLFALSDHYPNLVDYIRSGFPMGPMPTLDSTIIHKNHYKNNLEADIAEGYFKEESDIGRMAGPMPIADAEKFLNSKIYISPVGMVPKPNSVRGWRIIRDLSFPGKTEFSVNDLIPADGLTRWTTFDIFAEWYVPSVLLYLLTPPSPLPYLHAPLPSLSVCIPSGGITMKSRWACV